MGTQTEAIALSYEAEAEIIKKKMYKDGENVEQQKNILFFVFTNLNEWLLVFFIRLGCYADAVFMVMQFWNRKGFPFPNSALT